MLRVATESDLPTIESLMRGEAGFWKQAIRPNTLEIEMASAKDLAVVCEQDGRIVGYACAHDLGFRAYLSECIVAAAARGNGIGERLVEHIQDKLRQRGCAVLFSDVWKSAEGFYRALGWSEPDVILLRKRLIDKGL